MPNRKKDDDRLGREKKFLDLPEFPGGKEAFRKFVADNLRYPAEALEKKIEGLVYITYWVDGNGKVTDAEVTRGIGHGCDDEAIRLVRLLKFGKVKNRGMKVKASMRTKIQFKLPPKPGIQYQYTTTSSKSTKPAEAENKKGGSITYSITISPNLPENSV